MMQISIMNFIRHYKMSFMLILILLYIIVPLKYDKIFFQTIFVSIIVFLFIFLNIQKIGLHFFLNLLIIFFVSHFLGCLINSFIFIGYFFIVKRVDTIFYFMFLLHDIIIFLLSYVVAVFIYKIIRWII